MFALKWFGGQAGFPFLTGEAQLRARCLCFLLSFLRSASTRSLRFLKNKKSQKQPAVITATRRPQTIAHPGFRWQRLRFRRRPRKRIINALPFPDVDLNKRNSSRPTSAEKLYLFQDGTTTAVYEHFGKGPTNTPGRRRAVSIIIKEAEHFSSIGHVNMPYSMQFMATIYPGWPTYPDGSEVSSAFTGG